MTLTPETLAQLASYAEGDADAYFPKSISNATMLELIAGYGPRLATHRHKKRGAEYALFGIGKMQAENWMEQGEDHRETLGPDYTPVDMREVAIYRSVDDGSLWVRPREEFEDGRFEAIVPTASTPFADGWISHNGGPCPVPGEKRVKVWFKDGFQSQTHYADLWSETCWTHSDPNPTNHIIAYRPEGQGEKP